MSAEDDNPPLPPSGMDFEPTLEFQSEGDKRKVRDRRSKQEREQEKVSEFWRQSLATDIGRRELWAFLQEAGTFNQMFACGPNGFPQPDATWFNLGQRELGLKLYHKLMAIDPESIIQMHRECDSRFAKPKRTSERKTEENLGD